MYRPQHEYCCTRGLVTYAIYITTLINSDEWYGNSNTITVCMQTHPVTYMQDIVAITSMILMVLATRLTF